MTDTSASEHRALPPRSGDYRLAVYGGMFDPPHIGHIAVVDAVRRSGLVDRVLIVPCGVPPHRTPPVADGPTRLALCIHTWADLPDVAVSDIECAADPAASQTTIETVEDLAAAPDLLGLGEIALELSLVVGADQLERLHTWHRWTDLVRAALVLAVPRGGGPDHADLERTAAGLAEAAGVDAGRIRILPTVGVTASSTAIRAAAARGDRGAVAALVAPAIVDDVLEAYGATGD